PSRIYNNRDSEDTVQFAETGVYGVHMVNETRARYSRLRSRQEGNASLPTTVVLDAFTGGGSPLTLSFTNQDRLERPPPRRLLLPPRPHSQRHANPGGLLATLALGGLLPRRQAISGLRRSAEPGGQGNYTHCSSDLLYL